MKKNSCLLLFIFLTTICTGQKQDFEWIVNFDFLKFKREAGSGCTKISFNSESGNPNIYFDSVNITEFYRSASCIADQNTGEFLFAFNGAHAEDATGERIINWEQIIDNCEPILQGHLILPFPNRESDYILFTSRLEFVGGEPVVAVTELAYSIISKMDTARMMVTQGRKVLIRDTLDPGRITACKHANGRDWWVIIPIHGIHHFYSILLTPNGIDTLFIQKLSDKYRASDFGTASFSPSGQYYGIMTEVVNNKYLNGIGTYLDFYNFDRCNGKLFRHQSIYIDTIDGFNAGAEFSPNNQFLYTCTGNIIKQYQIENDTVSNQGIIIGIYDGFLSEYRPGRFSSNRFSYMQLAPDNRIYIGYDISPTKEFHTIDKPNIHSALCNVKQHNVLLPTLKTTMPFFPKFRLGPIDGSLCDTLGIDNIPWCHWRYDQDTINYLRFEFTDLSAYEVEEWYWDFGDAGSASNHSREKNPTHQFSDNGVYRVCLIVKNKNGADTLCRILRIGTVKNDDAETITGIDIQIWPNPCEDDLIINILDYNPQKMTARLYHTLGALITTQPLLIGSNTISMKDQQPGMYFLTICENGVQVKAESIIKK